MRDWHNDSQLTASPGTVLREGFVRQLVELTGLGVALDFLIEQTRVEFIEPIAQFRDFFGRELFDAGLNLLKLGHERSLAAIGLADYGCRLMPPLTPTLSP